MRKGTKTLPLPAVGGSVSGTVFRSRKPARVELGVGRGSARVTTLETIQRVGRETRHKEHKAAVHRRSRTEQVRIGNRLDPPAARHRLANTRDEQIQFL